MEEIAQSSASEQEASLETVIETHEDLVVNLSEDTILGDLFSYSKLIRLVNGNFVLKDLETEEGRWREITLVCDKKLSQAEHSWAEWVDISNGMSRIYTGPNEMLPFKDPGSAFPLYRLAPFKVVYWFMRAGYEAHKKFQEHYDSDDSIFEEGVSSTLQTFLEHHEGGPIWLHADYFQEAGALIGHSYHGWLGHRFDKYTASFERYWTQDQHDLEEGQPIKSLLGAMLGDTNLSRIEEVFSWAQDFVGGVPRAVSMPVSRNRTETTAVYECGYGQRLSLNANCETSTSGPAHMIIADEQDFTPRKVRP